MEIKNCNVNLLKKLSYESKLKKLYEQIICLDNLENSLEVMCESLMEIFLLEKLLVIEIDKNNLIFRKYLTKRKDKDKSLVGEKYIKK